MFSNNRKFGNWEPPYKESALNKSTKAFFSRNFDPDALPKSKVPKANLRRKYRKTLEWAFAGSLALLFVLGQAARQISLTAGTAKKVEIKIEVADIPQTQQVRRPPPPPRPSVPVPSESEEIPEDLTIASTDIDLTDIPPPPAPPAEDFEGIFVAYDEPPRIIGGMAALSRELKYPKVAQRAGVEGMVFVKVLVGLDGRTERAEVIKSKPENMGFEKSAVEAIQKVKWEPAKQRDRKIRVWVSIPVQFKLVSS